MSNSNNKKEVQQSTEEVAEIVRGIIRQVFTKIKSEEVGEVSVPFPPNSKFEEINEIVEHLCNYHLNGLIAVPVFTDIQDEELCFYPVDNLDKVDVDEDNMTKPPDSIIYLMDKGVIDV